MKAANVPTGRAETFTDAAKAKEALPRFGLPVVVKADGLAAGKGVVVAETKEEAEAAIDDMLVMNKFGAAGAEVLIEEFLDGEECSILAMTDGETVVLLPGSQDHKRIFDGDKGPNTGGMGAYSPAPVVTDAMLPEIENYPPPAWKGKYVKIKYVTQLPTRTPQFAFFCNLPQWVKDPYKRFLENKLRQHFDFTGCPIQVYTRAK
jgi:biotin carboxylase